MNILENALESNHDAAAKRNAFLTNVFLTPDGVKVQVRGTILQLKEKSFPSFKIVKIIDSKEHI